MQTRLKQNVSRSRALVAGLALVASPAAAFGQGLTTVTGAGVPEDGMTPALWAEQSGIFRKYGLDVQIASQRSGAATTAAVVGGTDAVWGFCAFGTDATVAELARAVARDLHVHHHAVRVRRVDTIPTTSSGKTDYQVVQGWVELAEQASGPTTGM